ncbi:MAG: OsmC family protein [Acidiferrobacteraceae bacterium]
MKATVRWVDGMQFSGVSETGHEVVMDGAPEYGGHDQGPRPMELVLLGMGGCTAFDIVHILKKGRQPVEGCEAVLEAERAPEDPKVFTRIHVHFAIRGHGLNPDQVARAISLSSEKYCSASIMLGKTARITHDFEIIEAEGP